MRNADPENPVSRSGVAVSGIAPADIILRHSSIDLAPPVWAIHGSLVEADSFAVTDNISRLVLFGHGGDDQFTFGSVDNDLDQLVTPRNFFGQRQQNYIVNAVGGAGNDLVIARDNNSTAERSYEVFGNWILPTEFNPDGIDSEFAGIWSDEVETTQLFTNDRSSNIRVRANRDVDYFFFAGESDSAAGDTIRLQNFVGLDPFLIEGPDGLSTWYFGSEDDDFNPIRFFNYDNIQGA